jgi:hypothetical protein
MKKTFVNKIIKKIILRNRAKREHNLIGKWQGKKTKVVRANGDLTQVTDTNQFSDSLEVSSEFAFSWSIAKTGLIQFKNDYTNLVFKTQQLLGLGTGDNWEVKRLTFNKMVLLQKDENQNTLIEYHFEKDLNSYNVG